MLLMLVLSIHLFLGLRLSSIVSLSCAFTSSTVLSSLDDDLNYSATVSDNSLTLVLLKKNTLCHFLTVLHNGLPLLALIIESLLVTLVLQDILDISFNRHTSNASRLLMCSRFKIHCLRRSMAKQSYRSRQVVGIRRR